MRKEIFSPPYEDGLLVFRNQRDWGFSVSWFLLILCWSFVVMKTSCRNQISRYIYYSFQLRCTVNQKDYKTQLSLPHLQNRKQANKKHRPLPPGEDFGIFTFAFGFRVSSFANVRILFHSPLVIRSKLLKTRENPNTEPKATWDCVCSISLSNCYLPKRLLLRFWSHVIISRSNENHYVYSRDQVCYARHYCTGMFVQMIFNLVLASSRDSKWRPWGRGWIIFNWYHIPWVSTHTSHLGNTCR